ncbi:MAG: type II secretion system F family protein [Pirellulales bacterium]|nr:type II secretion system F family protein [Pirellulales bacterium]
MAIIIILFILILALVIIASAVVEILRRHRRMQQHALLCTLAATVDRGMPLVQMLEACARETGGIYGARVAEFSHLIREGAGVPRALFLQRKVFPDGVIPLLFVGFASGTPGKAIHQALDSLKTRPLAAALAARLAYLVLFFLVASSIFTFICYKIVPSYEKIFQEFGLRLPSVTLSFINFCHLGMTSFLIAGCLLVVYSLGIFFLLRFFGIINWDPPGLRRLTWRPHTAAILDGLALAVENRRPLPEYFGSLSERYPQQAVRGQLIQIAADLQVGMDCWDSLFRQGLIRQADRTLLEAAHRAGNLAWALSEVAENQRRRWAYQLHYAVNLLYPLVVLAMGAVVLWVMVAIFSPLINLIHGLS